MSSESSGLCNELTGEAPIGVGLWDYLGRRVQEQQLPAANAAELSDRLRGAWREMPFDFVRKLIASMTRRVEAVMLARGGHTRY